MYYAICCEHIKAICADQLGVIGMSFNTTIDHQDDGIQIHVKFEGDASGIFPDTSEPVYMVYYPSQHNVKFVNGERLQVFDECVGIKLIDSSGGERKWLNRRRTVEFFQSNDWRYLLGVLSASGASVCKYFQRFCDECNHYIVHTNEFGNGEGLQEYFLAVSIRVPGADASGGDLTIEMYFDKLVETATSNYSQKERKVQSELNELSEYIRLKVQYPHRARMPADIAFLAKLLESKEAELVWLRGFHERALAVHQGLHSRLGGLSQLPDHLVDSQIISRLYKR